MGTSLAFRAMSGLGSETVSQLRVERGETRDHPTRSPWSGDGCFACVSVHGRTGVFGRFHSLTKQLTTVELESGWDLGPNPWGCVT
jgi:hypothetical protein